MSIFKDLEEKNEYEELVRKAFNDGVLVFDEQGGWAVNQRFMFDETIRPGLRQVVSLLSDEAEIAELGEYLKVISVIRPF